MNPKMESFHESFRETPPFPPAVELLSDPQKAGEFWPNKIITKEFLNQLESRKELNERLDAVLSGLPKPDMPLQETISQNYLTENKVIDLYASLSDLLEKDSDYERIILYLPFEFLPDTSDKNSSEKFSSEAQRFKTAYMSAWNNLLSTQDVRANFVDGDVLEVESRKGDLPRVVKAAHLIPKLVEKGFLDIERVFELMEQSDDETLKQVFDPFFTTKRNQGGVGLGMHIVYNLVTQTLGGTIECTSSPGKGVLFLITTPLFRGHQT